jgi:hypothetical protein
MFIPAMNDQMASSCAFRKRQKQRQGVLMIPRGIENLPVHRANWALPPIGGSPLPTNVRERCQPVLEVCSNPLRAELSAAGTVSSRVRSGSELTPR